MLFFPVSSSYNPSPPIQNPEVKNTSQLTVKIAPVSSQNSKQAFPQVKRGGGGGEVEVEKAPYQFS